MLLYIAPQAVQEKNEVYGWPLASEGILRIQPNFFLRSDC